MAVAAAPISPAVGVDDDGPVWPDEATEAAMRAELADRGEVVLSAPVANNSAVADDEDENVSGGASAKKPLPELDELVNRIPADVRETLEDLFRAKFVKVTRVPTKVLKTAAS